MFAIVLKMCTGGKCRLFPRHDGCFFFLCVCIAGELECSAVCLQGGTPGDCHRAVGAPSTAGAH